MKGYHDLTYYPEARQVPGLLLYRFDAPLFFANADVFRERVRDRIAERAETPVRWVIVAAEPITDVDTTAAEVLDALEAELADQRHHARLRRAQGPGPRAPPPLRRDRAGAGRAHLPDRRDGGHRLPAGDRPVLDRLGGRRSERPPVTLDPASVESGPSGRP